MQVRALNMTVRNGVGESGQVMRPHLGGSFETRRHLYQGRLAKGRSKEAHPEWRTKDDPRGDLHDRIGSLTKQTETKGTTQ